MKYQTQKKDIAQEVFYKIVIDKNMVRTTFWGRLLLFQASRKDLLSRIWNYDSKYLHYITFHTQSSVASHY